mmetsp:Transcript_28806/g.67010  ORF Transcript_28806/g.67010 Transcript_28806/m.67010 type:complete len:2135 (-) Transcript_28806:150-6554(-)
MSESSGYSQVPRNEDEEEEADSSDAASEEEESEIEAPEESDEDSDISHDAVHVQEEEAVETIVAPRGQVVVGLEWPKRHSSLPSASFGASRLPGQPGVAWKDCHPGAFGIAPFWDSWYHNLLYGKRKAARKDEEELKQDQENADPPDGAADPDAEDLETGGEPARAPRTKKSKKDKTEPAKKENFVRADDPHQLEAFGLSPIESSAVVEKIVLGEDLGGDNASALFESAKVGDVILTNVLVRTSTLKLEQMKDSAGLTPLHMAAAYGHIGCVASLTSSKEDLAIRSNDISSGCPGGSPADFAFVCRPELWHEMKASLVPPPELWEAEMVDAWSPRCVFHDAVRYEASVLFDFLLEAFTDSGIVRRDLVNQRDGNGRTALELAMKERRSMVASLLEIGAALAREDDWMLLTRYTEDLEKLLTLLELKDSNVSRLGLQAVSLNEAKLYALQECLKGRIKRQCSISYLDLSGCTPDEVSTSEIIEKGLGDVSIKRDLLYLDLTGVNIGPEGLNALVNDFLRNPNQPVDHEAGDHQPRLETLILRECGVDDEGAATLFQPSGEFVFPHLKLLDMTSNRLSYTTAELVVDNLAKWDPVIQAARNVGPTPPPVTIRIWGNIYIKPRELQRYVDQSIQDEALRKTVCKCIDVLAGETLLEMVASDSFTAAPSRRAPAKNNNEISLALSGGFVDSCHAMICCAGPSHSEDASLKTPLLSESREAGSSSRTKPLIPGAAIGGARERRFLATQRRMTEKQQTALERVNNIPPYPADPFAKSASERDDDVPADWTNEMKMMLNFRNFEKRGKAQWARDVRERYADLQEMRRMATKKCREMEAALASAKAGRCPGDDTPVVFNHVWDGYNDQMERDDDLWKQEQRDAGVAPRRRDDEDSLSDSDLSDEGYGGRPMGSKDNIGRKEVMETISSFMNSQPPEEFPGTDPDQLRSHLYGDFEEQRWTEDLTEPVWKVYPLKVIFAKSKSKESLEAKQDAAALATSASSPRVQRRAEGKKTKKKKEREEPTEQFLDMDLKDFIPPQVVTAQDALLMKMQESVGFWILVHLLIVLGSSMFATFWPLAASALIDAIRDGIGSVDDHMDERGNATLQQLSVAMEAKEELFWQSSFPTQEWCMTALILSFSSALLTATYFHLGHWAWRWFHSQARPNPVTLFFRGWMFILLVLFLLPVAIASVSLSQIVMCEAGVPIAMDEADVSSCVALGHWTFVNSSTFFFQDGRIWPRSMSDVDMLRSAIAATLIAAAATYFSLLYRTEQGHFVPKHAAIGDVNTVAVNTGTNTALGMEVGGRYTQVAGQIYQGMPVFVRKSANGTRWLRKGCKDDVNENANSWYLMPTSPLKIEIDVTPHIFPWLGTLQTYQGVTVTNGVESYEKFNGVYRKGRALFGQSNSLVYKKQGRAIDPTILVGYPYDHRESVWNKFTDTFSNANKWTSNMRALTEMDHKAKPHPGGLVDEVAAKEIDRAFTDELVDSLKDLNNEHILRLATFIQAVYAQILAPGDQSRTEKAEKAGKEFMDAWDAEKSKQGTVTKMRGRRSDFRANFIAHAILSLQGNLPEHDVSKVAKPAGLYSWQLTDVHPDEEPDDGIVCRQVEGSTGTFVSATGAELKKLGQAVWEMDIGGAQEKDEDEPKHERQSAWWVVPEMKATYKPRAMWKPIPGRLLYNLNSIFGWMVVARTASVLLDVIFDCLVVRKYWMSGYPTFASISLTLVLAPAVACWAFLYAQGMMEAKDLLLCVSQTEVAVEALHTLRTGKVGQNLLWVAVAEACLESLSQTLFQTYTLLLHVGSKTAQQMSEAAEGGQHLSHSSDSSGSGGGSTVIVASVMWGMVNVALVISTLDQHGMTVSHTRTALYRLVMRYCEVASRVSSIALFAVYFRPEGDLKHNTQKAVFILMALDYVMMVALLSWWDRGGRWLNLFWGMMSCLVAPPCFMEQFKSFQPVYYCARALELTCMIVAGVLSGQGTAKLTSNPEALPFIGMFFVATSVFTILTLSTVIIHLPPYLRRAAVRHISKVRFWSHLDGPEEAPMAVVDTKDEAGNTKVGGEDAFVRPLKGLELEFEDGSIVVPLEPGKRRRKMPECIEMKMLRGEEIVEVRRCKWKHNDREYSGFTMLTNFGRLGGTRYLDEEEEEE